MPEDTEGIWATEWEYCPVYTGTDSRPTFITSAGDALRTGKFKRRHMTFRLTFWEGVRLSAVFGKFTYPVCHLGN
jgi:hypothetical protein